MSIRSASIQAYRNALRATHLAFKGDQEVLQAARNKVKQGYQETLTSPQAEIEERLTKLEEVSKFLVKNIVQGKRDNEGKYMLNFHEKTELGDNETIKQGNKANLGSLAGAKVKKCSDRT